MPFELSHSFNYLTGGLVDSRFFKNPLWVALIITIIIMIIIPITQGFVIWRGVFIYIFSLIIIFMATASISRTVNKAKEIEGAAEIMGDLSYLNNLGGVEINPRFSENNQNQHSISPDLVDSNF